MRLVELIAPVLGARCVVVVGDGGEAVVVDAGGGVAAGVLELVGREHLDVRAVLATHGHVDHTWDAGPLAVRLGVPVLLHHADRYRLADPWGTLGVLGASSGRPDGPLAAVLRQVGIDPADYVEPPRVTTFGAVPGADGRSPDEELGALLGAPGLHLTARHAPGHTEGSTLYLLDADGPAPVVLSGDVLFAGSIGRTDLPGGDGRAMARTLRDVVRRLPTAARVLPGHGPATSVVAELATNPYLG